MKENSKAILTYVKDNEGKDFTYTDIADELGIPAKSVNGSLTALQRKELIFRDEKTIADADGTTKKVKFIRITEKGKTFDPDAEETK